MTQPPGPGPGDRPPGPSARPPTFGPPGGYGPPPGYYQGQYGPGYYGPPAYPGGGYYPPQYAPPYYQAPRPGCVPLRPLGLGDILDGAFRVIRRNPKTTLGLSAVVAVIEAVIGAVSLFVAVRALNHVDFRFGATGGTSTFSANPLQLLTTFLDVLTGAVLTGMLTLVVTQDVLGRRLTIGETWRQVRPRMWTLLGLSLATTILEVLGLLVCIAPGVWLWGIWAVAMPACMVERLGVGASMGRSKALVDRTFWRVWGIRALGVLITRFISFLILLPFLIIGFAAFFDTLDDTGSVVWLVVFFGVGSLIGRTFVAPVQAGIDALLYVDLRMRKEGLDLALQQAVAAPAGPVAAD